MPKEWRTAAQRFRDVKSGVGELICVCDEMRRLCHLGGKASSLGQVRRALELIRALLRPKHIPWARFHNTSNSENMFYW